MQPGGEQEHLGVEEVLVTKHSPRSSHSKAGFLLYLSSPRNRSASKVVVECEPLT